jgi:LuxR family glucitol operon transcriptional activator
MASVASRTAYVLLSAIEEDLRSLIGEYASDQSPEEVIPAPVLERIRERRKRDRVPAEPEHVSQALPYLDFQDSFDTLMRLRSKLPESLIEGFKPLLTRLPSLVSVRNRVAHNRPLEVDDLPLVVDFSTDLTAIPDAQWASTVAARREIRSDDPGSVFRLAAVLISDPVTAVANNLPSPDFDETSLLGRREERRQLMRALRGAWPVISILGDGGIGKTALALQLCYDLVQSTDCPFEAVVWVTAKNAQLTSTEIVRIETAVQDSLGLFASATAALGGTGDAFKATDELLEVLAAFPTLLVLDNVETVLDEGFPAFLREIPNGSKVLITSRIGVKTENPYKLTGLSVDDSMKLLRILARVRGVRLLQDATDGELEFWARKMGCHPAHIKWFVAGIQAGRSPEQLLSDNGLVLDFCMSNVYDYLGDHARAALKSMVVVPGSHTLAELAFLNGLDAAETQRVVLELTTTNFVSQVRGGASGTALELSDFARAYLQRIFVSTSAIGKA